MRNLRGSRKRTRTAPDPTSTTPSEAVVLDEASVVLGGAARDRDAAIDEAGALLVAAGAVDAAYVAAMHERERSVSTHMGNGLALPHGGHDSAPAVRRTALSFVRYAEPLDWAGEPVEFVVGLAGTGTEHLALISRLARVFTDAAQVERLRTAATPADVLAVLA